MAFSIVQITNIGASVTADQMRTLFSFIGTVEDVKLYPESDNPLIAVQSKICFCKFTDAEDAGVALHLNNTVFIDRALIVAPYSEAAIPNENVGLKAMAVAPTATAGSKFPRWPPNVVNTVVGTGPGAVVHTTDPKFEALGLPPYPPLPASTDPQKIDEIRRSIYVGNLDAFQVTPESLMQFFSQAGEIMYVRMAGDQTQPTRFAFIEFSHQSSVATALSFNGMMFLGRALKINHSNSAITKPATATQSAHRDIEEAMRKVKEADKLITAAIEPGSSVFQRKLFGISGDLRKKSKSRSKSRDRKRRSRSRSRKRSRRSRSRSRGRRSSRSRRSRSKENSKKSEKSSGSRSRRSRSRGRRSKSRDRSKRSRRSRSRGGRRSRSRSKEAGKRPDKSRDRRRRSRSKDRSRRKSRSKDRSRRKSRSRSRSKEAGKRPDKSRDRKSKKSSSRRSRSRSNDRRKEKEKDRRSSKDSKKAATVKRDYDEEEKGYEGDKPETKQSVKKDSSEERESPEKPMEVDASREASEKREERDDSVAKDEQDNDGKGDKDSDDNDSDRDDTPPKEKRGDETPSMDDSD